jgi:epoxyqueuosine reductase
MNNSTPNTADDAEKAAVRVHTIANEVGFALAGIAPAQQSDNEQALMDWLDAEKYGEMSYLAKYTPQRLDPAVILPGAQSVICVADLYPASTPTDQSSSKTSITNVHSQFELESNDENASENPRGQIARYAWGDDYHKIIKRRLFKMADALKQQWPGAEFKCCVDTAPVLEREHAMRAGLGWVGKHTLLIHPKLGSWMLLGEIITTLKIQTSEQADWPNSTVPPTDHCGTCTRCIDACPTDCITPYSLDATQCISYLTIEHRNIIDEKLHDKMGDWIAGCDICQQVCPHNQEEQGVRPPASGSISPNTSNFQEQYKTRPPGPSISLLEILNWTPEDRQQILTGSALKRIKIDMWKRNALIALGNTLIKQDNPAIRQRIADICNDTNESELVRHTATQVLNRIALN